MKIATKTLSIDTKSPIEIIDITDKVYDFCSKNPVKEGVLLVSSIHTTAAIRINEACPGLEKDIQIFFERLVPSKSEYSHNQITNDGRPNAHSHLINYLLGGSESLPVSDGRPVLGTWQRVFFLELDGARNGRNVRLTLIGE